jgi:cation transport ATPase
MTEEEIERSRRRFEIAGAIVCAHCFGYLLWVVNTESNRGILSTRNYSSLIGFVCLTLSCYLGAYRFLDRHCILPFERIRLNWMFISFLGTSLSLIITSLPVWLRHAGERTGEFALTFLWVLGFVNLLMLPVMAVVWSVGFIARLVRREIEYSKVVID